MILLPGAMRRAAYAANTSRASESQICVDGWGRWLMLIVLLAGQFMALLDTTDTSFNIGLNCGNGQM